MNSLLSHRTWRTIRAVSLAHGLGFNTNLSKQAGSDYVRRALLDGGRLRRAFKALAEHERDALLTLQAAGGSLPLTEFTAQFGLIRPYRPWREDAHFHPWKQPVSATEKLWHLAFIEIMHGRPDAVVIADEVLALLPPVPVPQPKPVDLSTDTAAMVENGRGLFCRDTAAFLAASPHLKWLQGRWLSSASMNRINQQLYIKEALADVRREAQTGRLRFIHYTAAAAGLLADHTITTCGWRWLSEPHRWQTLLEAITRDLDCRSSLWAAFDFPAVRTHAWQAVIASLSELPPAQIVEREAFWGRLRHLISRRDLAALLDGPLTWIGWVIPCGDSFMVTCPDVEIQQAAEIKLHYDVIDGQIPMLPALKPLVELALWAQTDERYLRMDAAAVLRAAEAGVSLQQITAVLAEISGSPLPKALYEQISQWFKAAQRLTLRPLLVLTVPDADDMRALRSDWRIRPLLGEMLSPQHIVVHSQTSAELKRKLARRGYPVQQPDEAAEQTSPSLTDIEYAYLAMRVYQLTSSFTHPTVPMPGRAVTAFAQGLSDERREALDQIAQAQVEELRRAMTGQINSSSVAQDCPAAISEAVQQALDEKRSLTIRYFSPAHGEETVRTIRPMLIYERNGATYIEAWCELDHDTRTFRMDRIVGCLTAKEINHSLASQVIN